MNEFTVVMPALNAAATIGDALAALAKSERRPAEVVVVDDGSSDETAEIAASHGARVMATEDGPRGGSVARNLGASSAETAYLVFVDADVSVRPETLGLLLRPMDEEASVAASFGSYDDRPSAPGAVSRYRNLLHHYTHQHADREAWTFWSGLGAIRKDVFLEEGGFDESMPGVSVEDIELGMRLRKAGHRVRLVPEAQATHHKQWTVRGTVKTDVFQRAVPWTRLLRTVEGVPADLNVDPVSRVSAALVGLMLCLLVVALLGLAGWGVGWGWMIGVAGGAGLALIGVCAVLGVLHRGFYALLWRRGGLKLLIAGILMHWFYFFYSSATFVGVNLYDRFSGD